MTLLRALFGLFLLAAGAAPVAWGQAALPAASGDYAIPLYSVGIANNNTFVGDIVSGAYAFWSCSRTYSAATRGNKACNICQSNGTTCADVYSDPGTGYVPVPVIGGFTCDNSCQVKTMYDQTGNGHDCTQATALMRSGTVPTVLGLAFVYTGWSRVDSQSYSCTGGAYTGTNLTIGAYAQRTGSTTLTNFIVRQNYSTGPDDLEYNAAANSVRMAGTSAITATASDNVWHSLFAIFGGTSGLVVDGTLTAASINGNNGTGGLCLGTGGASCSGTNSPDMVMAETFIYTSSLSSAQYTAIYNNQAASY